MEQRPGRYEGDWLWKSLWIWSTYSDLSRVWKYFFYFEAHSFYLLVGLIVVLGIAFLVSYAISYRFTKPVTRMIQSIQAFGKPI